MSIALVCFGLCWPVGLSVPGRPLEPVAPPDPGNLQSQDTPEEKPLSPSTPDPTAKHQEELARCRKGIVDPEARPVERRRWASQLLSYDTQPARALSVELLGLADRPNVQRTLCEVVSERARRTPERLDDSLVPPLIELLGADHDDLRRVAAAALADFADPGIPETLGALAADPNAPLAKRLAAIDALAPNTHRRAVVGQLIGLLDAAETQITRRVVETLEPATLQSFGHDVPRWRRWWEGKSRLTEEAWLAEQVRSLRDRERRLRDALDRFRQETRRKQTLVTRRFHVLLLELYRSLTQDQQGPKLAEWLADPLPEVKGTALAIIKAGIADEGRRPGGAVLAAVLSLLQDAAPEIRREVLDIVQNVRDARVVKAVLAQLDRETDPETRQAIFQALRRLDHIEALPALIAEIASPNALPQCVREASLALGQIAGKADVSKESPAAVTALVERYRTVAPDAVAVRAGLLSAMAGIASPSFKPLFVEAVEADDPTILREAVRGLRTIGEGSKLPRLRTLMAHSDPLVRLEAIEAVARLGREDADLERLLTRLDPADEPNERAREAAWRGFREFAGRRTLDARIAIAQRLREQPELEARYLTELADTLAAQNTNGEQLEAVLDRLSTILEGQGHYVEAADRLRALCEACRTRTGADNLTYGLRLLKVMLRSNPRPPVAEVITRFATTNTDQKDRIVQVVADYVGGEPDGSAVPDLNALLVDLRSVPKTTLGPEWNQLLDQIAARATSDRSPKRSGTPTPGS